MRDTDRIGTATLNTNQNIAGALARLGLAETARFLLWTVACFAVLGADGLGGPAGRARRRRDSAEADESTLALMCVALFGLVVSPVSWSHHWVWVLPTVWSPPSLCLPPAQRRVGIAQRRGSGADGVDTDRR